MREALARSDRDFVSSEDDDDGSRSGFVATLTLILRRPLEIAGCLTMAGFTVAIIVNALGLQTGTHPAPFFTRSGAAMSEAAQPAPATTASLPERDALVRDLQVELSARGYYDGNADGLLGPKSNAAIRAFQTRLGLTPDGQPSEDLLARIRAVTPVQQRQDAADQGRADGGDPIGALITASAPPAAGRAGARPSAVTTPAPAVATPPSKRVLAVENALAVLGYGPLKVDGVLDADARAAIGRFEQSRSLPVTGQISARLVRELKAVSGLPLE